jgi:hypothetical protein
LGRRPAFLGNFGTGRLKELHTGRFAEKGEAEPKVIARRSVAMGEGYFDYRVVSLLANAFYVRTAQTRVKIFPARMSFGFCYRGDVKKLLAGLATEKQVDFFLFRGLTGIKERQPNGFPALRCADGFQSRALDLLLQFA